MILWTGLKVRLKIMTFDFDKIFHKLSNPIPKDCPCRKCDEPKYSVDNPYYRSTKCEECKVYKDWRDDNG